MQGRNHLFELGYLLAERTDRAVGRMRGKIAKGVVAPVVRQPPPDDERFADEVLDGQQLDRGDTHLLELLDYRWVGQAGVAAAQVLGHIGMHPGVAARRFRGNPRLGGEF